MNKRLISAVLAAVVLGSCPVAALASTVPSATAQAHAGQILIDASRHGEAWYVNPQTYARVYLGRPAEALERLQRRATPTSYNNIINISDSEATPPADAVYAAEQSGRVLTPNDLIGAAWYVWPTLKTRLRLATPDDAWQVMRTGLMATAAELAAIPVEAEASQLPPSGEHAVKSIVSADTLILDDGSQVKLMSVEIPANPDLQQAAMDRLQAVIGNGQVRLESDIRDADDTGAKLRCIFAGDVNLSYDLVRNGLAFHNITPPNFKYAEMLIVGGLDAQAQQKGFWRKK